MSGLSNYPPGVTGNELQISGPSWESTEDVICPECDSDVEASAWGHSGTAHYTCSNCHYEWEIPEDDMSQGADEYDVWRDEGLERE